MDFKMRLKSVPSSHEESGPSENNDVMHHNFSLNTIAKDQIITRNRITNQSLYIASAESALSPGH